MENSKYSYVVSKGEAINTVLLSDVTMTPISVPWETMDYQMSDNEIGFDVIYPVRKQYLSQILNNDVLEDINYAKLYTPFENTRVELSGFLTNPTELVSWAYFELNSEKNTQLPIKVTTAGKVVIWINNTKVTTFAPFSRNIPSSTIVNFNISKGNNIVKIKFIELAERDFNYGFELINLSDDLLHCEIPLLISEEEYLSALETLYSINLTRDYYSEGEIILNFDNNSIQRSTLAVIEVNPKKITLNNKQKDGNITDYSVDDFKFELKPGQKEYKIINVDDFKSVGITRIYVKLQLTSGQFIERKLVFSSFNEKLFEKICTGDTIEKRKKQALEYYASLDLADINVALAKIYLNQFNYDKDMELLTPSFLLIESKGDCADFVLAPLLAMFYKYPEKFDERLKMNIKDLVLNFRYWVDEPGNDVMWYFSENHAFLFHICQYFAGLLYPEENFVVSGRKGTEQFQLGKDRIISWYKRFFKYGLAEWNSTTYIPIDLIGLFSLSIAADDEKIVENTEKALDYLFKIIAYNYHGRTVSSTYGRVYEHNLKAMQQGELSSVIQIAWKKGYFNQALRAAFLFSISTYVPKVELNSYIELEEPIELFYSQGKNGAQTYIYKTRDYSLSSLIDYKMGTHGHQQHLGTISLGNDTTQLWINNPGEYAYSGENRPSYWAGNDLMPKVDQDKNKAFYYFDLTKSNFKLIHLYLPNWKLDEIIIKDKAVFIRKECTYLAVIFNNSIELTDFGPLKNREIKSIGEKHSIFVFVSTFDETNLEFDKFIMAVEEGIKQVGSKIEFMFDSEKIVFSKEIVNIKPERCEFNL